MGLLETHSTPRPQDSQPLDSGQIACAAGFETVLKTVTLRGGLYNYLRALALDAEAGATGFLEFRCYLGGNLISRRWAKRKSTLGQIGSPAPIGEFLGCDSADFEVRVYNSGAASYNAFCDGEVPAYNAPLR